MLSVFRVLRGFDPRGTSQVQPSHSKGGTAGDSWAVAAAPGPQLGPGELLPLPILLCRLGRPGSARPTLLLLGKAPHSLTPLLRGAWPCWSPAGPSVSDQPPKWGFHLHAELFLPRV